MKQPAQIIHEFVLAHLSDKPVAQRAVMYRSLAFFAATPAERNEYDSLANELEAIERKHDQLVLDFKRRAEG